MAIKRIWHGWTTPENADEYEATVRQVVAPGIEAMNIEGYRGLELLRGPESVGPDGQSEVQFVTILTFDHLENIVALQGDDYTKAHVPEDAQQFLKRWDSHAVHYEVRN